MRDFTNLMLQPWVCFFPESIRVRVIGVDMNILSTFCLAFGSVVYCIVSWLKKKIQILLLFTYWSKLFQLSLNNFLEERPWKTNEEAVLRTEHEPSLVIPVTGGAEQVPWARSIHLKGACPGPIGGLFLGHSEIRAGVVQSTDVVSFSVLRL